MTALGMVFMVIGGLLLLSAARGYALYRVSRRRAAGSGWTRLVGGMLLTGVALLVLGYLLAS